MFNSRQAAAISENLRSILKIDGNTVSTGILSHVKKSTKRSNGLYVSEIDRVQVRLIQSRKPKKIVCEIERSREKEAFVKGISVERSC